MYTYIHVILNFIYFKKHFSNSFVLYFSSSQLNDLDKIRESCELFSLQFPLAPEIWMKWLQIELTIATSETELKRVHGLFKRALADYFCKYT